MNFSSPEKVASVIQIMKDAEIRRSPNRNLINRLYNGVPPFTPQEEKDNNIRVNVNWGEGADLLLQGREQYENAHLTADPVFTVKLPNAPKSKASTYSEKITTRIAKLFKSSRPFFHTRREQIASIVLHGLGPIMWEDCDKWSPFFVGIDDLLIPTNTLVTLEGLNHFAVRRMMTAGQLFRKTFGLPEDKRDPGWNLKVVKQILNDIKDVNAQPSNFNWVDHPEKVTEIWKENSMFYDNDSTPKVWMWDFYHQEDDKERPCWYRKIILDNDCATTKTGTVESPLAYIYDNKKPFADSIDEIIQIEFADGNNVPPFMLHSTRSLGLRLFDTVQMLNRLRSQFIQKVFEDMMNLFRVSDPSDRSRLEQIYLGLNYGIFPEGLNFVTRDQRYSPDAKLVEMQLSNLKQLLGEGSQQYTQDIDTGTNKERTAFEVSTLLNQSTKLTGSMLNLSYRQKEFTYHEICRRLTRKDSLDWEVKKFRAGLINDGVEERFIDVDQWDINVTRILGSGNAQLEAAQAQALMSIRNILNPEAQNEVAHDYVFAITHDPQRATRLVPLDGAPKISDSVHDTELAFGAMMSGATVTPKPGLNPTEVVDTMLKLMGDAIQKINMSGGVGDWQKINGLGTCMTYTKAWIAQVAQDEAAGPKVKQYMSVIGLMENMLKAFAQRLTEKEQAEAQKGQVDPAEMAKAQMEMQVKKQELALEQQKHQQTMQMNAQKHQQEMVQNEQKLQADQARQNAETEAALFTQGMEAGNKGTGKAE